MACQTKIAKTIVQQEGDYLLAVKGNQERLAKAVRAAFASRRQAAVDKTQWQTERHHGRVESRTCHVLSAEQLEGNFSRWTRLCNIVMVQNYRAEKGKEPSLEYRDYISSKALRKVRTSPRTTLAYEQKRVRGIQIKQGGLPFKAQYRSNPVCSKAP